MLTALLFTAFVQPARANALFDISKVTITKIADEVSSEPLLVENDCSSLNKSNRPNFELPSLDGVDWSQIFTFGEKLWQIVQNNKPVVNVTSPVSHALPRGLTCWADLDQWQAPRTQTYEVAYQNGFRMNVVKFRFRLQYTYGGGRSGKGHYLANVTVLPAELDVIWGYTFNASVDVGQAVNLGSADDPIAGLDLTLKWTVKTPIKHSENSFHFFVQGDGVAQADK